MINLALFGAFLIFLFPIEGASPEIVFTLPKSGLSKIINAATMKISQDKQAYQSPRNYSTGIGYYSTLVNYFNATFEEIFIEPSQVNFSIISSYKVIQIHMTNISGSSYVYINDGISSYQLCRASVTYQDAVGDVFVSISQDSNGRPTMQANANVNIEFNQINITIERYCYISKDDHDDLKREFRNGFYNRFFPDYVKYKVQKEVDAVNQNFSQILLDYNIYKSVYEHYSLFSDPLMENDSLISGIDSFPYYGNQSNINKNIKVSDLPVVDSNNTKDAQLFLSESFFQNILDTNFEAGLLSCNNIITFLGRIFNLSCFAVRSPRFIIMNNITLNESVQCFVSYQSPLRTFNFSISFDVLYDLNLTFVNSTIYFTIEKTSRLANIALSYIPPEFIWIKTLITLTTFSSSKTAIRQILEKNGIPLPQIVQIPYLNLEKYYKSNYVAIYFNLFN